jgi:hypothetical protein
MLGATCRPYPYRLRRDISQYRNNRVTRLGDKAGELRPFSARKVAFETDLVCTFSCAITMGHLERKSEQNLSDSLLGSRICDQGRSVVRNPG